MSGAKDMDKRLLNSNSNSNSNSNNSSSNVNSNANSRTTSSNTQYNSNNNNNNNSNRSSTLQAASQPTSDSIHANAKDFPRVVTAEGLHNAITKFEPVDHGFIWINLLELGAVPMLAKLFNLHPLCVAGFSDIRTNAVLLPTATSTFVSLLYFDLNASSQANMVKQYFCVGKSFLITFEVEVMGTEEEEENSYLSSANMLTMNRVDKIHRMCVEVGPLYLMYEIVMESIAIQGTVLEFISRSLFYFKCNVTVKLKYRKKLDILKKLHVIQEVVHMMFNYMVRNKDVLQSFADDLRIHSSKSVHGQVNGRVQNIVREALPTPSANRDLCLSNSLHGPFFVDLIDSYVYMCENIDNERDESNRLHNAIDVLNNMRQSNASVST